MYHVTTTAGLFRYLPNAPDALDDHLRDQLLDADAPMQIDWTVTRPDGHPVRGCAGTAGHDPMIEANLNALHHGLVEDFATALYEASRKPIS